MESTKQKQQLKVTEIELTYKSKVKSSSRPTINSSRDAYEVFLENWEDSKIELVEQFKVMLLNRANRVLGIFNLSTGGISGTVVDPKIVFAATLKATACSIILAHNHPSGNLTASHQDIELTKKIKEGCRLLEIQLLDHIIVTKEGYLSFADEALF